MKLNINYSNLLDIINLNFGVYYPLKEFVSKEDFLSIVKKYSLANGKFFPIPIFINISKSLYERKKKTKIVKVFYKSKKVCNLIVKSFYKVDKNKFPLFNVFDQIDKNSKIDVIKFNCSNEIAVNLFKFNKIKYNQIHQFIDNSLSLDFNNHVNSINDIVEFQQYFKEMVLQKNEII